MRELSILDLFRPFLPTLFAVGNLFQVRCRYAARAVGLAQSPGGLSDGMS